MGMHVVDLSMFILRAQGKNVEKKVDPVFKHPIFDSAREKVKRAMEQLEKSQETLENSFYTCFKCGSNKVFSIAKQVRSADAGASVFNECRDCHNKWRDGGLLNVRQICHNESQGGSFLFNYIGHFLGCDEKVK